jgi:hypothetical protein
VINPHADLATARAGSGWLLTQPDFNPTVPNVARVYDCLLGGCFLYPHITGRAWCHLSALLTASRGAGLLTAPERQLP